VEKGCCFWHNSFVEKKFCLVKGATALSTECTQIALRFHGVKKREVRGQFNGGAISSDGGGLLLREVDKRIGLIQRFAGCFTDYRDPNLIEHRLEELVGQRIYGLALGYEDLNDHEQLRWDPLLGVLVEKTEPGGEPLAGKSTLNRLELTPEKASAEDRYKKIVLHHEAAPKTGPRTAREAAWLKIVPSAMAEGLTGGR
jgi:hypothetical protein